MKQAISQKVARKNGAGASRSIAADDAPHSVLIKGARLLDPASDFDGTATLGIRDGRIDYRGNRAPRASYDEVIDAKGLWLMPGIVDLCARLREPGATHKASMMSESPAALAAGITALCIPPDTHPVIDNAAVVVRVNRIAKAAAGAHVYMLGALTQDLAGNALAEMSALKQAGCVGVSNGLAPLANSLVARRALEYASSLNLTVHVVPQDAALSNDGCAHEGVVALRLGLPAIPVAAETLAIRQWLSLIEDTGAQVHFGRLSSARGAELVASAKARGLPVSADVAAHQLFLTEDDIEGFDAQSHVRPPLRTAQDRDALRSAVASGVIDAICSDHQPHERDAKVNPYPLTEPGISALETLLPLSLRLIEDGILTPLQMAQRLSAAPAWILSVTGGSLAVGTRADMLLIDPMQEWILEPAAMLSRGRNTPFAGQTFRGRVLQRFRGGQRGL